LFRHGYSLTPFRVKWVGSYEKFHIDINAAENGVFVPKSVNLRLNNKTYMEAVYKALEKADNREKAIEILQDIAEQIRLTGNYP